MLSVMEFNLERSLTVKQQNFTENLVFPLRANWHFYSTVDSAFAVAALCLLPLTGSRLSDPHCCQRYPLRSKTFIVHSCKDKPIFLFLTIIKESTNGHGWGLWWRRHPEPSISPQWRSYIIYIIFLRYSLTQVWWLVPNCDMTYKLIEW